MTLTDKIQESVQRLPVEFQAEVLDFVEFLLQKSEINGDDERPDLSLALAMRGLEDEETPEYTVSDLKVAFK